MEDLGTVVNENSAPLVINTAGVARLLDRSYQTFRNTRDQLHAAGMPHPLNIPGHPIWLLSEITTWLHSRSPQLRQTNASAQTTPIAAPQPTLPEKRGPGRPRKNPQFSRSEKQGPGRPPKNAAVQRKK